VSTHAPEDELLAAFARVPGLGWTVMVDQPADVVLAPVRAERELAYGMLLVVVALAILIGSLVSGQLVRPLTALVDASRSLARGNRAVALPKGGGREIETLVASFADMSDRLAERAAMAESAVRARDEFLSVAAHELKTPIAALRGFAQLFQQYQSNGAETRSDRAGVIVSQIDRQSARLTRLVNQLLDLSRLETGKLTLDRRPTAVAPLVDDAVNTFRGLHPQREFVLSIESAATIQADATRLNQVLTNLLDNAVKFSPKDSPIETTIAPNGGSTVQIIVRDHGIGIPAEMRERIFERFYQVDDGNWRGGLGLGLFVSHQIVALHGGRISVNCPSDGGTSVVISLPVDGNGAEARDG
jgi:signal transduction histidine kinase